MFKNNKSVFAFCSVLSLNSVASSLTFAERDCKTKEPLIATFGVAETVENKENKESGHLSQAKDDMRHNALNEKAVDESLTSENVRKDFKNTNVNIVLLGPPGSGKGTHFENIANKYGLLHYSTGDMLRAEAAKGTEDGKVAESYMARGKLVPSNIIEKLTRVNLLNSKNGHVIDGSPRTVDEAKFLDSIGLNIDAVLYLDVKDEDIIKRVSGRRVCKCGSSYHVLYNRPKVDGVCDKCGEKLILRHDDEMNVVKERLKVFHEKTEPVLDYYEKQGKLVRINGSGSIDEVKQRILDVLNKDKRLVSIKK